MNIFKLLFQSNLYLEGKKQKRIQYTALLNKRRPDIKNVQEVVEQIINLPDTKLQKAILFWTAKGTLTPPYDYEMLNNVMDILRIKRGDFQNYISPEEVLKQQEEIVSTRPIDPDTCKELTNKVNLGNGVVVYDVQDDKEGQQKMREIINTHAGVKANPWCLLHGDGNGNLSDGTIGYNAWSYWNHYIALKKRVAFQNGKLLAFSANDTQKLTWWDMQDHPHVDIPCKGTPVLDKEGYEAMPPDMRIPLLARSAAISQQTLQKMIQDTKDADILYNIALNKKTDPQQLAELSNSQYDLVRLAVAQNNNTPKDILQKLVIDKNSLVRRYAKFAIDPNCQLPESDVWMTVFGLPAEQIFTIHYRYTNDPRLTATRRCQMHQNINVKGTGVSTIAAHAAWDNIKYWDLDQLGYRSCKIKNIIWIEINGKKHKVIHSQNQTSITESKFNTIFNILSKK